MKIINIIVRILIGAEDAISFSLATIWICNIEKAKNLYKINSNSASGNNALASHIGGSFLIFIALVGIYFITKDDVWLLSAMLAVGVIFMTRIFSIAFSGISSYAWIAIINEILIMALLWLERVRSISNKH